MMRTPLTILVLLIVQITYGQTQPLFRVIQDDRVGYINTKGQLVIRPVFLNGNDFSEGLAAVRKNGFYGFIDETGTFVIQPAYDFAKSFENGLAFVYVKGKPHIINKDGSEALPPVYKGIEFLGNRKAIVTTLSGRLGIINLASKVLVVDTVFSSIKYFEDGVAIVEEFIPPSKKRRRDERTGVIDTTGQFIVPLGKYKEIGAFNEGRAVVQLKSKEPFIDGVIDTKDNLIFTRSQTDDSYINSIFQRGVASVKLCRKEKTDKHDSVLISGKDYEGYINLQGEVVLDDTNYRYVRNFSNDRAFVETDNDEYFIIDRNFKRVGKDSYQAIHTEFREGLAIVKTPAGYGIIDTLGSFRVPYRYYEIDEAGIVDGYFFFAAEKADDTKLFGIADLQGNVVVKPVMQNFDRTGFKHGLIKGLVDDRLAYIDKSGIIIWQQQKDTSPALKYFNVDFMTRGYCHAYSNIVYSSGHHSGGWGVSSNFPVKINMARFPANMLAMTIDTTLMDTFANAYHGYTLFVSNTTVDTIQFNAQDSRLYLNLQAQDDRGEWKDIEYLPNSWCGNSYHTVELEPGAYWRFTIPNYQGEFRTKIRARLRYINKKDRKHDLVICSNVINGSINPAQFWNKLPYYPGGIMDPYSE